MASADDRDDEQTGKTAGLSQPQPSDASTFSDLIGLVKLAVAQHFRSIAKSSDSRAASDLPRLFRKARSEATAEVPLPRGTEQLAESLAKDLELFCDAFEGKQSVPSATRLEWVVHFLLAENVKHLISTIGRDATKRDLLKVIHDLVSKPRGRPSTLSVATLRKAKRLKMQGKSYACIGRQLKMSGQQVRTALEYHFPEKKSR